MAERHDMFDAIVMADERFHGEGYREGYAEGSALGRIEGRQHGTTHGARVGSEIGCYQGFALAWKCLLHSGGAKRDRAGPYLVQACWSRGGRRRWRPVAPAVEASGRNCGRKVKVAEALIGMIENFPYEDATYDKLHEDLDSIRGKFKQLCSLLNVQPDFKVTAEGSGFSF